MEALAQFAASFPEAAKDVRMNLASVLQQSSLSPAQRFGVALAVAYAVREPALVAAVTAASGAEATPAVVADAQAAAALMAMNNVFYRFRHMVGKASYEQLPARLRMQRLASPQTDKATFELLCLAVSAVNGCQTCVGAHEHAVVAAGLTETQVLDAVRIAAVVHAAAVAAGCRSAIPA